MPALLITLPALWESIQEFFAPIIAFLTKALIAGFPFINAFLILIIGILGASLYGKTQPYTRRLLLRCLGIAVILFSISQLWDAWFVLEEGKLEADGTMLAVISVLIGWLFGEALMLDKLMGWMGISLSRFFAAKPSPAEIAKAKKTTPSPEFLAAEKRKLQDTADGFVIAATLCGFSSLLFTGYLEGRTMNEPVPMLIKLAFDAVLVFTLAVAYGNSPAFAAIPTLLTQLALWLVDAKWGDVLSVTLTGQLAIVGGIIMLCGGICIVSGKRFRAANLIPAIFIPIVFTLAADKVTEAVEEKVDAKK
jgi:uncharacterized membrane protein YqgA involved in biofilm formation